jgi:hypothetical protein
MMRRRKWSRLQEASTTRAREAVEADEVTITEGAGALVMNPSAPTSPTLPGYLILTNRRVLFAPTDYPSNEVRWCALDGVIGLREFAHDRVDGKGAVLLVERAPHLFPVPDPSNPGMEVDWLFQCDRELSTAIYDAAEVHFQGSTSGPSEPLA